jgi:hypothetical protein
MAGFKSAAKHKRELAKLDKRNAKDQKRAARKAERARAGTVTQPLPINAVTPLRPVDSRIEKGAATPKPLTLAEAVERWKSTSVVNPKTRPRGLSGRRS